MTVIRVPITDRAEWLKWRRSTLGASEVPIVCGATTYKTPLRLYAEKTGAVGEPEVTAAMKRGTHLEGAVVEYVKEMRPDWVITRPGLWLHDPETRLSCTPDAVAQIPEGGVCGIEAIIQCKVVARPVYDRDWKGQGPDGEDVPPAMYVLQTLTEAMLWGAEKGYIACLIIDTFSAELGMFDVHRHPGAELRILKCVRDFWADVEAGREPKADYARDLGLIERLYPPDDKADAVDLSQDNRIHELLDERSLLKQAMKLNEAVCDAIDAEIIEKLVGATTAIAAGWKITRKMTHRREHTVPAKSYPVLRISERKP